MSQWVVILVASLVLAVVGVLGPGAGDEQRGGSMPRIIISPR